MAIPEFEDGRYVKLTDPETGDPLPEHNWVWSPQGLIAMHYPEMWGEVLFAERTIPRISTPPGEHRAIADRGHPDAGLLSAKTVRQ